MSSKVFNFQQFSITREFAAMKLTTDAVLLGSWSSYILKEYFCNLIKPAEEIKVLDVGTGTGVLALIIAQFYSNANITAIDIDEGAIHDASINFKSSVFSDRIRAKLASFDDYCKSVLTITNVEIDDSDKSNSLKKVNLIICNPPYFDFSVPYEKESRKNARCNSSLPPSDFFTNSIELLDKHNGHICLIIPYDQENCYIEIAKSLNLVAIDRVHISSIEGKSPYVSLLHFMINDTNNETLKDCSYCKTEYLFGLDGGKSTFWYNLTKDLYLKV